MNNVEVRLLRLVLSNYRSEIEGQRLNALLSFKRLRRALRLRSDHAGHAGAVYPQGGWS